MNSYLQYHQRLYPLMTKQDQIKLLFQNEFASGHMITNLEEVKDYYYQELKNIPLEKHQNLYDLIGNNMARVNMIPYANMQLDHNYLIESFILSANKNKDQKNNFTNEALKLVSQDELIQKYLRGNIHHSHIYRQNYLPHYRVINKSFITMKMQELQILNFLKNLTGFNIIALEGRAASGKTTIANLLKENENISIINCDDFFLPKEQKTKARLTEIGGNIDYQALLNLLKRLEINKKVDYQIFNCAEQKYQDYSMIIKKTVILEGVYSYHPVLRPYINYLFYMPVNKSVQNNRLKLRTTYNHFLQEWLPLEEKYFQSYDFIAKADLLI